MIKTDEIMFFVNQGYSFICSMCELLHEAKDRGVPDGKCLAKDGCGSPIAGGSFHEYRGPLAVFDKFCFACGDQATDVLRVQGHVRAIGCCQAHLELVKSLKPTGKEAVKIKVIDKNGEEIKMETDEKTRLKLF